MAVSTIPQTHKRVHVSQQAESLTFESNTFAYSGISITIPAHCYYNLRVTVIYNTAEPSGAALAHKSDVLELWGCIAYSDVSSNASACGATTAISRTFYAWGRLKGSTNRGSVRVDGWYEPID